MQHIVFFVEYLCFVLWKPRNLVKLKSLATHTVNNAAYVRVEQVQNQRPFFSGVFSLYSTDRLCNIPLGRCQYKRVQRRNVHACKPIVLLEFMLDKLKF